MKPCELDMWNLVGKSSKNIWNIVSEFKITDMVVVWTFEFVPNKFHMYKNCKYIISSS